MYRHPVRHSLMRTLGSRISCKATVLYIPKWLSCGHALERMMPTDTSQPTALSPSDGASSQWAEGSFKNQGSCSAHGGAVCSAN